MSSDLAGDVAPAGAGPTLAGHALQRALRPAIASRRGSCDETVAPVGGVVLFSPPKKLTFAGKIREEAQDWYLGWHMAPALRRYPCLVCPA